MNNLMKASNDVTGSMTANEVLLKSGLNWETVKQPLYDACGNIVPNAFGIFRTDNQKPIGIVGNVYQAYSNHDLALTLEKLVTEKLATFKRGWCWDNGAKVGIVAEIPKHLYVLGKDEIAVQITARNSFDGSSPVGYSVDVLRLVCSNGLKKFVTKSFIRARHCAITDQTLLNAREILGLAVNNIDGILSQAEAMARAQANAQMVEQFLKGLNLNKIEDEPTRRENKRYELLRTFDHGIGLSEPLYRHSVWALYNAAVETIDHKDGIADIETKAISAEYGAGASFKETALKEALALVGYRR